MVRSHGPYDWVILERIPRDKGGLDSRVIESRERFWIEHYVKTLGRSHVLNKDLVPEGGPRLVALDRLSSNPVIPFDV